ncbi:hypothetical protein [Mucilaginibacter paludis]|uniref:Uncharacterized protein n=1 Tax=Mucilaginibacter paludis DSM 18603 TaxID=714943 RepID=H1Y622_9SPHI|nr:hypothetical protein [Mucilaginibacter paludis]EHQ30981.1 hypothetical protein Mucpa_6932 [Mucilaginibacter paludis DSM 18603]
MKTIQLKLYEFEELSEQAKQKAIADNADFNVNYNWWDMVYEDAKNIGLKITGFDLDRAHYCNAEFIHDAIFTAKQVRNDHGEQADTYGEAQEFQEKRDQLANSWPKDENGEFENVDELDIALDECEGDFLKRMSKRYLSILDNEFDHLTSDEAIADALIANEYWFTEDGKMATHLVNLVQTA